MSQKHLRIIPLTMLAVLLIACGQQKTSSPAADSQPMAADSAAAPASKDSMPQDMPMPAGDAAHAQEHSAIGTVTAVDAAAGTVTIAHEAVASARWPAMTMTFKLADPNQAAGLHANDKVHFNFRLSEKGDATVTTITPAGQGM